MSFRRSLSLSLSLARTSVSEFIGTTNAILLFISKRSAALNLFEGQFFFWNKSRETFRAFITPFSFMLLIMSYTVIPMLTSRVQSIWQRLRNTLAAGSRIAADAQAALEKGKNVEADVAGGIDEEERQPNEVSSHEQESVKPLTTQMNVLTVSGNSAGTISSSDAQEGTNVSCPSQDIGKGIRALEKKDPKMKKAAPPFLFGCKSGSCEEKGEAALEKGKNVEADVAGGIDEEERQPNEVSSHEQESVKPLTTQMNVLTVSGNSAGTISSSDAQEGTNVSCPSQDIGKGIRALEKKDPKMKKAAPPFLFGCKSGSCEEKGEMAFGEGRSLPVQSLAALFLFLFGVMPVFASASFTIVHYNNCPIPIFPSLIPTGGSMKIENITSLGAIYPSEVQNYTLPDGWAGFGFFGTGCTLDGLTAHNCTTGNCKGRGCTAEDSPVATTYIISDDGNITMSAERGYNLELEIMPMCIGCRSASCKAQLESCPNDLRLVNSSGAVVGCKPPGKGLHFSESQCIIPGDYYGISAVRITCPLKNCITKITVSCQH